jgi:hypothetical protein
MTATCPKSNTVREFMGLSPTNPIGKCRSGSGKDFDRPCGLLKPTHSFTSYGEILLEQASLS